MGKVKKLFSKKTGSYDVTKPVGMDKKLKAKKGKQVKLKRLQKTEDWIVESVKKPPMDSPDVVEKVVEVPPVRLLATDSNWQVLEVSKKFDKPKDFKIRFDDDSSSTESESSQMVHQEYVSKFEKPKDFKIRFDDDSSSTESESSQMKHHEYESYLHDRSSVTSGESDGQGVETSGTGTVGGTGPFFGLVTPAKQSCATVTSAASGGEVDSVVGGKSPRNGQDQDRRKISGPKKQTAFQRAKIEFENIKQGKIQKKKLVKEKQVEAKKRREENQAERKENMKEFSKKTSKGQPLIKSRINFLLKKIEKRQ